eukprot:TRINITY_DN5757_c0_g4_i3.p1 TRINITY_DN5757_c0_g4~~TRINITY_DN5757_c0_g4_i3.p1  ORF type:complete len:125 (-),score=22.78 TRINITY_DN5757_c0_g4_i3:147-473(-)
MCIRDSHNISTEVDNLPMLELKDSPSKNTDKRTRRLMYQDQKGGKLVEIPKSLFGYVTNSTKEYELLTTFYKTWAQKNSEGVKSGVPSISVKIPQDDADPGTSRFDEW